MRVCLAIWFLVAGLAGGEVLRVRVAAANLTSDKQPRYSVDNGNHSNPEGAGARILKGLKPDVVLIQEFNTAGPPGAWVRATFGPGYGYFREEVEGIPNGIISRYPMVAKGSWDDPVLSNRDFAWARLKVREGLEIWAVSVHWHSRGSASRAKQAAALMGFLEKEVPKGAMLVVGGDFNTRTTEEPCFEVLRPRLAIPGRLPADALGNIHTNTPRNRPYDWVLASPGLEKAAMPVEAGGRKYPGGLVFDSRVFEPLEAVAPVQRGDSGLKMMQHMAVVRDFQFVREDGKWRVP